VLDKHAPGVRFSTAAGRKALGSIIPSAARKRVRRVAAVAFSLPENDGWRWGLRVDLSSVRSLMEALHFGQAPKKYTR